MLTPSESVVSVHRDKKLKQDKNSTRLHINILVHQAELSENLFH